KLERIVALDPQADLFSDKSSLATPEGGLGEFTFLARSPVPHEFFIRHDGVFERPAISRLSLQFSIRTGAGQLWPQMPNLEWLILTPDKELPLKPITDTTSGLTKSGEVTFANLPEWPVYNLYGREGRWLGCRLRNRLPRPATLTETDPITGLPSIESLTLSA